MILLFRLASVSWGLFGLLFLFFSKIKIEESEKFSPFESGFDGKQKRSLRFSIRFLLLSLVFLVFDLELLFIIPLLLQQRAWGVIGLLYFVLLVLTLGALYERYEGALSWHT